MSADVDRLKKLITECTEAGNYGDEQTEMMRLLQEAAYELGCYLDTIRAPHEPNADLPAELFDGYAVFLELQKYQSARQRTGRENVADVLDAVVRLIRAAQAKGAGPVVCEECGWEVTQGSHDSDCSKRASQETGAARE